jgi:hypothetical protein
MRRSAMRRSAMRRSTTRDMTKHDTTETERWSTTIPPRVVASPSVVWCAGHRHNRCMGGRLAPPPPPPSLSLYAPQHAYLKGTGGKGKGTEHGPSGCLTYPKEKSSDRPWHCGQQSINSWFERFSSLFPCRAFNPSMFSATANDLPERGVVGGSQKPQ